MPMRFAVQREDLLKGTVLQPGWYLCTITDVKQSAAKTDGSMNTTVTFTVKEGAFKGVPLARVFSEKAPGFAVGFIEAIIKRKMKAEGEEFDFEMTKGKDIKVYVLNEKYQNRIVNRAEDFQAA